ncbi:penicillin-binding protein 1A [Arundinibacter roseus]|uniref:Penicillin-binding protein n=1 Tax=Arundinibacter roseus TaxID=2070510 RepID=A0A4R4K7B9_9BACT|nr:transglycosylase domain-containing protein [Arundinibacter roseus]TDB63360.1 penicillin-binding protein [Arundinibacter roseus]
MLRFFYQKKIKPFFLTNESPPRIRYFRLAFSLAAGLGVLLFGALGLFFFLIFSGFFGKIPTQAELKLRQNETASEVYSADSVLLGRYFIFDRTNVSYASISPNVIKALIATEDVRFYEHSGVDSRSLMRVLVKSILLQRESSGGGSTITQQLAKNLYPRKSYRFFEIPINKVKEMITARRLENVYSKEEILELYLNTVSFGGTIFGIERAARTFFDVPARRLKTEQAAVLVGMLKATTSYHPRYHPQRSQTRRNVVINQMVTYGELPKNVADSLKKLPLITAKVSREREENLAPYFREQLRVELAEWCESQTKPNGEPYNLYADGLKIYTTLDASMQRVAERAVRVRMAALQKQFDAHWRGRLPWGTDSSVVENALRRLPRYKAMQEAGLSEKEIRERLSKAVPMTLFSWNGPVKKTISAMDSLAYYQKFLNTGLISLDPATGFVKAWVGGINHALFNYDHVLSRRQVGSTFKPIVYAAALEKGIQPCDYLENKLTTYAQYENWAPANSDNQYGGKYSMQGALAQSVNTISAQLILKVGIPSTIRLAKSMGIRSELPTVPSLALGTANISLLEMATAYTAFANDGQATEPVYVTQIIDRSGRVIRQNKSQPAQQVLSSESAALMLSMMQAVVNEGSAASLRSGFGLTLDIAGKTGTTQNQTDGWFIGIVPGLVTGVWVGGESPLVRFRTLELGQGARTALPVWGEYMAGIQRGNLREGSTRFEPLPPELQSRLDCMSFVAEEEKTDFFEKILEALPFTRGTKEDRKERRRLKRERRKNG